MSALLLWVHVGWYVALTPLSLLGLAALGTPHLTACIVLGWIPGIVLVGNTQANYRLTARPLRALLVVGAVPLQVGVAVLLLGDSLAFYLVEVAFLELASFAVVTSALMLWHRPSGWMGAGVGCALVGVVGGVWGPTVAAGYSDEGLGWQLYLALAFLTACAEQFALVSAMIPGASPRRGWAASLTAFVMGSPGETVQPGLGGRPVLIVAYLFLAGLTAALLALGVVPGQA